MFVSYCAHRNILIQSCLVGSTETCLGQAAPLVVAMEAILAACPLSWKWKRLLRDPVRAPDVMSCPEEASASELSPGGLPVPVGCPVPVCLALEGLTVLFCTVLSV